MGNLYTHIVPHHNTYLDILQKLKFAWRTNPKNYKLIEKLQIELNQIKKPKLGKKKLTSSFDWVTQGQKAIPTDGK